MPELPSLSSSNSINPRLIRFQGNLPPQKPLLNVIIPNYQDASSKIYLLRNLPFVCLSAPVQDNEIAEIALAADVGEDGFIVFVDGCEVAIELGVWLVIIIFSIAVAVVVMMR